MRPGITEGSAQAEDFSAPESSVLEDHGGPEPHQFEPLAPDPIMPEAGALWTEAAQSQLLHYSQWIPRCSLKANLWLEGADALFLAARLYLSMGWF